jgi:hypothetical protein
MSTKMITFCRVGAKAILFFFSVFLFELENTGMRYYIRKARRNLRGAYLYRYTIVTYTSVPVTAKYNYGIVKIKVTSSIRYITRAYTYLYTLERL